MKAFVLDRYGKQSALRLAELPQPELGDDEVLVEVHAAGVDARSRHADQRGALLGLYAMLDGVFDQRN